MNQDSFAIALGLQPETYRRYERGETEPNLASLAKIRQVTHISLDHLVAGEPDLILTAPVSLPPKVKKAS